MRIDFLYSTYLQEQLWIFSLWGEICKLKLTSFYLNKSIYSKNLIFDEIWYYTNDNLLNFLAVVTRLIIEKKLLMRQYQRSLIIECVIPNLDNIWSYSFNIQTTQ